MIANLRASAWWAAALGAAAGVVLASCGGNAAAAEWMKVGDGPPGKGVGGVLVPLGPGERMLYLGGQSGDDAAPTQAYDPQARAWSDLPAAQPPARRGIHPYYQTAYDPSARRLYCLSYPGVLYVYDVAAQKWTGPTEVPELDGLSWHVVAIDPAGRRLVVVGADKKSDNLGWSRTVILDLDSGRWATLPPPPDDVVAEHRALVEAREAMIDLIGRVRLAWYRDPGGRGTDDERGELAGRLAAAGAMTAMRPFAADLRKAAEPLARGELLDALRALRAVERAVDQAAERRHPVPCSRRNAPLVFDARNKVFILFGGDHEDYLLNDTWVLDLSRAAWRRARPPAAPSPRAGHALAYLPGCGRVALYEGYAQSNSTDYGCQAWETIGPRQLWLYDAAADRWELAGAWQSGKGGKGDVSAPPEAGAFYGYSAQYYAPPALVATVGPGRGDRLILAVPATPRRPGGTWRLDMPAPSPATGPDDAVEKLARTPDERLYRRGMFLAAFCETPDEPKPTNLDALPANRWVRLPDPPHNVAYGCRQRDWGTAVWDARNEQVLLWGGGHCVRSASVVIHYSPISGRMIEGYDADEPYGRNGNGGYDSSLLGRPWVDTHSYNTYAYDPPSGLMVSGRGYLYDPARMDWQRRQRMETPFRYNWANTVLEATPHGVVAWGQTREDSDRYGLWLFDAKAGAWSDLKPAGKLYRCYCDSEGMTYDAKRDRLVLGWGGGYEKAGDGSLTTFDFRTRKVEKLLPAAAELGRIRNTREMLYLDHADWIAFAEPYPHDRGEQPLAHPYLRIYDCAADRYFLLDAGAGPQHRVHGQGWCYDAKRKLVFVMTVRGEAYALRLDPASARRLDGPPAPQPAGEAGER